MIKQTSVVLITMSLCLAAGCNRGSANNSAKANSAAAAANASANAATPASAVNQGRINMTPGGMEAVQGARREALNFGSPAAEAVQGLTAMFGAPIEDATNSECGGGGATRIIRWSNGLRILARGDKFRGWEVQQAGVNALDDLHVGTTRAQLEANQASFETTTLGTEWTVGDGDQTVSGLVSDGAGAAVTAMWAGITCHMT